MAATRRIADAVATTRARASLSGPRLGLHQPDTDHPIADKVFITDVTVPRTVDPGESIEMVVDIENQARAGVTTAARFEDATLGGDGQTATWNIETVAVVGQSQDAATVRSTAGAFGSDTHEMQLSLTAPEEPGDYDYEIDVRGEITGDLMAVEFIPMTVRDLSDDEPDDGPDDDPEPEPEPDGPGWFARLLDFLNTAIDRAITTISDLVLGIRDLILGFAETVEEALYALADWLADNPLLLAAVATVAFYVAPRVADFVFGNFTPIGWLDRAAGSVLG